MDDRISTEIELLRTRWPNLEYSPQDRWVRITSYPLPRGWNVQSIAVAFQVPVAYPGTPPYGIYVPVGLTFNGLQPRNYAATQQKLPFEGTWWILSWLPQEGQWHPTADLLSGSNLLNWALAISVRFGEGA